MGHRQGLWNSDFVSCKKDTTTVDLQRKRINCRTIITKMIDLHLPRMLFRHFQLQWFQGEHVHSLSIPFMYGPQDLHHFLILPGVTEEDWTLWQAVINNCCCTRGKHGQDHLPTPRLNRVLLCNLHPEVESVHNPSDASRSQYSQSQCVSDDHHEFASSWIRQQLPYERIHGSRGPWKTLNISKVQISEKVPFISEFVCLYHIPEISRITNIIQ